MPERIYWEDSEKEKLISITAGIISKNPDVSLICALNKAQEQLPANRRRRVAAISSVEWLKDGVSKILRGEIAKVNGNGEPPKTELQIVEKYVSKSVSEFTTDELIRELARRQAKPIVEEVVAALSGVIAGALKGKDLTDLIKKKQIKTKVLIVGLLPDQEAHIRETFEDDLDLKFIKNGDDTSLRQLAQNSNFAIVMAKFVSHPQQDIVKTSCKNTFLCSGGMTKLKETLEIAYYSL